MRRNLLGSTGLKICPLVFGTLPMGPLQAKLSPEEGGWLIRAGLERGINLIDTAELYRTFAHIRAALDGFTGEVLIASKTHANDAATARAHVAKALRALGRERLDILHVHGARVADPFRDRKEVFEEILKMRDEGLVRFVGVSGHCVSSFRAAAQNPDVDVIHPLINRAGMGIIDGTAGEMAEAIRLAAEAGKGVYAMKALAGGNLLSEARRNLTWVRDLPGVHALAVGMLSEAEIDANLALITENKAPDAAWAPLEKATRRIAIMRDFCKGCGKCVPACTNAAITLAPDGKAQVDEARCILCGYCASACPEFVIRVV